MTPLEIFANAFAGASILLAGRNNVHTWWTGIVGCGLFAVFFWEGKLPGDAILQLFFIAASIYGWWAWMRGGSEPSSAPAREQTPRPPAERQELPIRRAGPRLTALAALGGLAFTIAWALLVARTLHSAAPIPDSAVLAFSVVGQILLMRRRIENWWFWVLVNTVSVPLYLSRGYYLSAGLYVVYWVNAIVSLRHWRRLMAAS